MPNFTHNSKIRQAFRTSTDKRLCYFPFLSILLPNSNKNPGIRQESLSTLPNSSQKLKIRQTVVFSLPNSVQKLKIRHGQQLSTSGPGTTNNSPLQDPARSTAGSAPPKEQPQTARCRASTQLINSYILIDDIQHAQQRILPVPLPAVVACL